MGWRERHWAAGDENEAARADDDPGIPLWEAIADKIRVRMMELLERNPLDSVQDCAQIVEAANALQVFHLRGQQIDQRENAVDDSDG